MKFAREWQTELLVLGIFLCAAFMAVYCNYVFIYHTNDTTGVAFVDASRRAYEQTLAGTRSFPYQWRVLGALMVHELSTLTGLNIHTIDFLLKGFFLFLSTVPLYWYSRTQASATGAMAVVFLYLLLVVVGFTEEYSIYNTNDIILYAGWHFCVWAAFHRRYYLVALCILLTTFAREVTVLACLLVGLAFLRKRAGFLPTFIVGLSFVFPWAFLHWLYPAPVKELAWFHNFYGNIPLLHPDVGSVLNALRRSFKVLLFFNVFWVVGILHLLKSKNTFNKDLFLVMCFYVCVLYITVIVRELRQFVPLAIILLPATIRELEQKQKSPQPQSQNA